MQGSTPIVGDMFRAARDSMRELRAEISEVTPGPLIGGVEFVNFLFRGERYSLPLKDPDWVIIGDGNAESDRSIALRCLLASQPTVHATNKRG